MIAHRKHIIKIHVCGFVAFLFQIDKIADLGKGITGNIYDLFRFERGTGPLLFTEGKHGQRGKIGPDRPAGAGQLGPGIGGRQGRLPAAAGTRPPPFTLRQERGQEP